MCDRLWQKTVTASVERNIRRRNDMCLCFEYGCFTYASLYNAYIDTHYTLQYIRHRMAAIIHIVILSK